MTGKEIITKLREMLLTTDEPTTEDLENIQLEQAVLVDGTMIEYMVFEVGQEVYIKSEDGEVLPLVDGDYELESGEKFMVVDGKISEIVPVEETEEPVIDDEPVVDEDMAEVEAARLREDGEHTHEELEKQIEGLTEMIADLVKKLDSVSSNYETQLEKYNKEIEDLKNAPAVELKKHTPEVNTNSNKSMSLLEMAKNFKKQ